MLEISNGYPNSASPLAGSPSPPGPSGGGGGGDKRAGLRVVIPSATATSLQPSPQDEVTTIHWS